VIAFSAVAGNVDVLVNNAGPLLPTAVDIAGIRLVQ
jgi:NADP-dependent 3-hydroxy acid dehydrogenase YdfG